jgi:acylphosphatase
MALTSELAKARTDQVLLGVMPTRVARKFLISGDVQGVGYRFFAQRAAARHQIVGYVRNCSDGTVEALAEGPANSVEAFKHDLATGPQWAEVNQIEEINLEPSGTYSTFRIER